MLLPRTPVQGVAFLLLMQLATVVRAEDNQTMLFDFSKPRCRQGMANRQRWRDGRRFGWEGPHHGEEP